MQKKTGITLFFICLFAVITTAQTLHSPIAATYTSLGAYSLNHVDVFSFTANQAALAQVKNAAISIYGERRFLLNELSYYNTAFALPTSSGNFGLKTTYFGSGNYNETQLGLAYGRKLGNKLDIGAQFNYNRINLTGYGNAGTISFEIGTIMHLTDQVHAGIHINNPVGGKFGKDQQEKLPSVYTVGLGYDASEKFLISAEIVKEEDQDVNINAGLQYRILPQVHARAGIATATTTAWIGIGLHLKTFRIDICSSYHPQLGMTPGLLLLFNFNQKKN